MTYSVQWSKNAIDAIIQIWLESSSGGRAEITRASAAVDRILRRDPGEKGESRDGRRRILFEFPLCVIFVVDEVDHIVHIVNARAAKNREN